MMIPCFDYLHLGSYWREIDQTETVPSFASRLAFHTMNGILRCPCPSINIGSESGDTLTRYGL